jgi:hypothetical protein
MLTCNILSVRKFVINQLLFMMQKTYIIILNHHLLKKEIQLQLDDINLLLVGKVLTANYVSVCLVCLESQMLCPILILPWFPS